MANNVPPAHTVWSQWASENMGPAQKILSGANHLETCSTHAAVCQAMWLRFRLIPCLLPGWLIDVSS